jgi:DNA-binding transcriptional regulator LsrR (DeoR family)
MTRGPASPSRKDRNDGVLQELSQIKRLLAVLLLKAGTTQSEIAAALEMDQADLSRMLPARKFRRFGGNPMG